MRAKLRFLKLSIISSLFYDFFFYTYKMLKEEKGEITDTHKTPCSLGY